VGISLNERMKPMSLEFWTLGDILLGVDELPNSILYLQGGYPWSSDSLGIIYDDFYDDVELESTAFYKENGLTDVLDTGTVQSIVVVAKRQRPDVSVDELVVAFNHYYKYDGFLRLGSDE
jgi:hypothetical protein